MSLIKIALIVPALASSVWLAEVAPHKNKDINWEDPNLKAAAAGHRSDKMEAAAQADRKKNKGLLDDAVIARRMRIERVLMTLDRIAEASLQMNPDNAASLEPVIIDLAERTLELTDEDAVSSKAADGELTEIEETVGRLVGAIHRMVEPEMSL